MPRHRPRPSGLTDVIPDRIDVAIPRGRRIPALKSPANVHVFAKDTFGLGREVIRVGDGLVLGLYSAERSLVDMVRLRHREGAEIAWESLRRWLRRKGARPPTLIEMARSFRGAASTVHHALEVVRKHAGNPVLPSLIGAVDALGGGEWPHAEG